MAKEVVMDIVFMHKFRFFGLCALSIVLVTQAALVTTVYERFYAMMPHILPGHDATLIITVGSLILGVLSAAINMVDGVQKPAEVGMGKRNAMGAGSTTIATLLFIAVGMSADWGLPVVFLIADGGLVIMGLVIVFDDTEQRRIELESRTAGTKRLNGGREPA